jgi:hypothetical protein
MTSKRSRPRTLFLCVFGAVAACAAAGIGGCQNAAYRGAEPSARSFYEDPDFHQTYIGVDFSWALQDPAPHVPDRPSSIAGLTLQP